MASMGYRVGRMVRNVRGFNPVRLVRDRKNAPRKPPIDPDQMTLQEHLIEFRNRLVKAMLGVFAGMIVGFAFAGRVYDYMRHVATNIDPNVQFLQTEPTEAFITYFKVAAYIGIILASPIIFYQIVRFLAPGLLPHELKYVLWSIPVASVLFICGVVFANLLVIPQFLHFLITFTAGFIGNFTVTAENYLSFFIRLSIGIGLIFQLPAVLFVLAKIRVVDVYKLRRWRRYAFLICAIAAAAITPTPDPFNMMFVCIPMYALYEIGAVLAYFALPRGERGNFFRSKPKAKELKAG